MSQHSYKNAEEACDDIQLIWDNCKKYNAEGSVHKFKFFLIVSYNYINLFIIIMQWIYKLADKMEKYGKKIMKNYIPQVQIQATSN